MQTIVDLIENFVDRLPPLLQLILGVFVAIAIFKILTFIADHFEKKKEDK